MAQLTAEEVKQLADNFMQMANDLGDYRYTNYDALTEEENLWLKELHNQTLSLTTELYTKSAVLVMNDAENALQQIKDITMETRAVYDKLTHVQTVLDRATAVLGLASNIINLDVDGITSSIGGLLPPA